jgi:hypothetical protein
MSGVRVEFERAFLGMTEVWVDFKSFFADGWHGLFYLLNRELVGWHDTFVDTFVDAMQLMTELSPRLAELTGMTLKVDPELLKAKLHELYAQTGKDIDRDFAAAQARRDEFRKGQLDAAKADLAAAAHEDLMNRTRAAFRAAFGKGGPEAKPLGPPDFSAARGAFLSGTGLVSQVFGGGGGIGQKLLDAQAKANDIAGDALRALNGIAGKLDDLPLAVWGD